MVYLPENAVDSITLDAIKNENIQISIMNVEPTTEKINSKHDHDEQKHTD